MLSCIILDVQFKKRVSESRAQPKKYFNEALQRKGLVNKSGLPWNYRISREI